MNDLEQFITNLCQSGMSVGSAMSLAFPLAEKMVTDASRKDDLERGGPLPYNARMVKTSALLLEIARKVNISTDHSLANLSQADIQAIAGAVEHEITNRLRLQSGSAIQ